jgi:hypothetical protein
MSLGVEPTDEQTSLEGVIVDAEDRRALAAGRVVLIGHVLPP